MPVKVKICGITNIPDARLACEAGADMLGFIFYPKSPRFITPREARDVIAAIPKAVQTVGVFVNAGICEVLETAELARVNVVQLHGEESPELCDQLDLPVMKAFRIQNEKSLEGLLPYSKPIWLLDSFVPGAMGGTGARFNWDLAIKAGSGGHPLFLAGGLTPENVGEAIRTVRPFGVDVSSGVERAPGQKDPEKVAAFVKAVREAEHD